MYNSSALKQSTTSDTPQQRLLLFNGRERPLGVGDARHGTVVTDPGPGGATVFTGSVSGSGRGFGKVRCAATLDLPGFLLIVSMFRFFGEPVASR